MQLFLIQGFQTPPILCSLSLFFPVSGVDLPAHYLLLLLASLCCYWLCACLPAIGWLEGGGASQLTQSRLSQFTKHNVGLTKERQGQNSPSSLSHLFSHFILRPTEVLSLKVSFQLPGEVVVKVSCAHQQGDKCFKCYGKSLPDCL